MSARTPKFIDREGALSQFGQLVDATASSVLAFAAPDGFGKTFLLRELRTENDSPRVKVILLDVSQNVSPVNWRLIRRIADQWPQAMNASRNQLDQFEARLGPLEETGVAHTIEIHIDKVEGDFVGGNKNISPGDSSDSELRGIRYQVERAFYLDLVAACKAQSAVTTATAPASSDAPASQPGPPQRIVFLLDNVEAVTKDVRDWLKNLLNWLNEGSLPALSVVMTGQQLPDDLRDAAGVVSEFELKAFTQDNVGQYLQAFGLPATQATAVFEKSGGIPLTVSAWVNSHLDGTSSPQT